MCGYDNIVCSDMGGIVVSRSILSEDMHNTILGTCEAADEAHNANVDADEYGADGTLLNPAPEIEYEEEG